MKQHGWVGVAVALLVAACSPVPPSPTAVPAPSPTATPSPAPARLSLVTEMAEFCGSIGGCAAYASLVPAGEARAPETRFYPLFEPREVPGLPSAIDPGSYVVRFRLVGISDAMPRVGDPFIEHTMATCETPVEVVRQPAVEIRVSFGRSSCVASVRYPDDGGTPG